MRPIAHCDRCRRRRYCQPVHFRDERGQIFRHTWLCRPCSTLVGVQDATAMAYRQRILHEEAWLQQLASLASETAVLTNPDGTITCIWITQEKGEE